MSADAPKIVATAANQAEAELMLARLQQEGIAGIEQRTTGNLEFGGTGARYISVAPADFERARELLAAEEPPFTDEELARLSDEAAGKATE
jgi:hypothetical protein